MKQLVADSSSEARYLTMLMTLFGLLALALAGSGIYGVIAYAVSQQRREIGIRIALGAERHDVLRLILGKGAVLAGAGVAAGLGGAILLTRFLRTMLYGVTPTDPLVLFGVAMMQIAVVLAASYVPAQRASKLDPMEALRYE